MATQTIISHETIWEDGPATHQAEKPYEDLILQHLNRLTAIGGKVDSEHAINSELRHNDLAALSRWTGIFQHYSPRLGDDIALGVGSMVAELVEASLSFVAESTAQYKSMISESQAVEGEHEAEIVLGKSDIDSTGPVDIEPAAAGMALMNDVAVLHTNKLEEDHVLPIMEDVLPIMEVEELAETPDDVVDLFDPDSNLAGVAAHSACWRISEHHVEWKIFARSEDNLLSRCADNIATGPWPEWHHRYADGLPFVEF